MNNLIRGRRSAGTLDSTPTAMSISRFGDPYPRRTIMRRLRRRAWIALVVTLIAGAVRSAADTPQKVQHDLAKAALTPPPLYPTKLPARIKDADAKLSIANGYFSVTWNRRGSVGGTKLGYLQFGRARGGQLSADLKTARQRGNHPRRVKVGRFRTWYLCGHVCGFDWRYGRFTYQAFGIYYLQPGAERRDLKRLIASARPLAAKVSRTWSLAAKVSRTAWRDCGTVRVKRPLSAT
jgi:hypothetical protein